MKVFQTALLATTLLLGTSAAYAESEGNNLAQVEVPAGTGVYATYVTNANGQLVPEMLAQAMVLTACNAPTAQIAARR